MYKLSLVIWTSVEILWGSQHAVIHQRSKSNIEIKLLIILIKAKVKTMPWRHTGGSRGIIPLILNFGSSWKWLFSFLPLLRHFRRSAAGVHWAGSWVGLRAYMDVSEDRQVFCSCRMVQPIRSTCVDRSSNVTNGSNCSNLLIVCNGTRVGTLIVAAIYLQLIQNRYMFRSFTVLQCSHQHCVQPVASDVEVVGYL